MASFRPARLIFAALLAALGATIACTSANDLGIEPPPDTSNGDDDDGSKGDDDDVDPPVDGGKDTGDGATPYLTDPKNCGAKNHSCQGAVCTDGVCTPEVIPTAGLRVDDYTFDDDGSLIVITSTAGPIYSEDIRRVAAGGQTSSLLFTKGSEVVGSIAFTQGALFGLYSDSFVRFDGVNGGAATMTAIKSQDVRDILFDRPNFYFESDYDMYRFDPASKQLTTFPHVANLDGKMVLASDGVATIYGFGTVMDSWQKAGSAPTRVSITNIPKNSFTLLATPSTLVGIARKLGGDCQTIKYTMWTAPAAGGADAHRVHRPRLGRPFGRVRLLGRERLC